MKKKPIFLIFAFVLVAVYYLQYRMDVRSTLLKGFEIVLTKRERDIRVLSTMAETFLSTGRQDVLEGHLTDAIRVRWIDFYMITYRGEVVLFNSVRPLSEEAYGTLAAIHPPDKVWEFRSEFEAVPSVRGPASAAVDKIEDFRFLETDLGDDRRLKMGFNLNREAFFEEINDRVKDENRRIFVLTILVVLGVFLFTFRDLFKIVGVIRSKGLRGLQDMQSLSKEAEILKQGFAGYQDTVKRLSHVNRVLGAQVLPSLKSELQSGRKPPYDFACTLVRTDINDFTRIFHSRPQDEFLNTINEFFTESSHVISRYEGLIHEFVGDEIIFYLKDEIHRNSFTAALACAAELGEVAERIHNRTSKQDQPYDFRIKTSLAHGTIRFGPLLNGFSLAGAPLIETTRVLSQVSEKNENTIHFDSRHVSLLHGGVRFDEAFRATLKGLDGERVIFRYLGHKPLDQVLSSETSHDVVLHDYRREHELVALFRHAVMNAESSVSPDIANLLRSVQVTKCTPEYATGVASLLQDALEVSSQLDSQFSKNLASFIGSLPRIIPANSFQEDMGHLLGKFLKHADHRVVANTIEAMEAFRSTGYAELNRELLDSPNPRVAANALVFVGKIEISKDVVKRTRSLLESQDLVQLGGGIFVWGEIAGHHGSRDTVYLRTHPEFMELEKKVKSVSFKHPSLRRLAQEALLKASGGDSGESASAGLAAS